MKKLIGYVLAFCMIFTQTMFAYTGVTDPNNLVQDTDGDGVADWADECPNTHADMSNLGCPKEYSFWDIMSLSAFVVAALAALAVGIASAIAQAGGSLAGLAALLRVSTAQVINVLWIATGFSLLVGAASLAVSYFSPPL